MNTKDSIEEMANDFQKKFDFHFIDKFEVKEWLTHTLQNHHTTLLTEILEGLPRKKEEMRDVPVCNSCNKPHFGRIKSEERCWCDTSGNFGYRQVSCDNTPRNQALQEVENYIRGLMTNGV